MPLKKALLLFTVLCWSWSGVFAQIDDSFVRDSIEIERGLAGTVDFEPFFRLVNETFDVNNRPLLSVVYRYTSPTEVEPHQRQILEYDNDGNTTLFLLEEWDADTETWQPIKQENSSYNGMGRIATLIRRVAIDGELENRRRWTYEYNATGKETLKLLEGWNATMSAWNNLSRKTTSYTTEGQIAQQLLENSNGGDWQNNRRRTWAYEMGQLQPSQTLGQVWSDTELSWVNDSRKTYSMAGNGLWSGSVVEQWDATTKEWVSDVRETFMVDLVNSTSTYALERWDDQWEADARSQYSYSVEQNTALLQRWNTTELAHENFLRYRTLFNNDRLPVQQTGMQAWDVDDASWQNETFTRRVSYFWRSGDPNSTTAPLVNSCTIPNPYWSGTVINCELSSQDFPLTLDVYNLYGQLIRHQQVSSPSFSAETSSLPSGLYVFKLSDERRVYQLEKIIVNN